MREARGRYNSAELVRARILVLLEYISRIQRPRTHDCVSSRTHCPFRQEPDS